MCRKYSQIVRKVSKRHLSSDRSHHKALVETGYWGRAGAGLLLISPTRVLLLKRSSRVEQPNTWGVPGGAIAPQEDPRKAALREGVEEMGRVPPFRLADKHVYQDGDFTYTTFVCEVKEAVADSFAPRLNWENSDWVWVDRNEVRTYNLHFGLPPVLSKIGW